MRCHGCYANQNRIVTSICGQHIWTRNSRWKSGWRVANSIAPSSLSVWPRCAPPCAPCWLAHSLELAGHLSIPHKATMLLPVGTKQRRKRQQKPDVRRMQEKIEIRKQIMDVRNLDDRIENGCKQFPIENLPAID